MLQPIERLSEILFGLIMVLTFTGSLSVATADRGEVKTMLIGALGCNIAWGIIDAIMYLMSCLHDRGRDIQTVRDLLNARSHDDAEAVIRSRIPDIVAQQLTPDMVDRIRLRGAEVAGQISTPRLGGDDLRGAAGVFLIVVISTFPVVAPFIVISDLHLAMRLSNAVAVAMLALIGYYFGRAAGLNAAVTSATMVVLGCVLVALTIALGG